MKKQMLKIIFLTILYRALGFLRDMLIASNFGSGIETDIFFLSQSIPNLILEIFAVGAFSSALIPIMLEKKINLNEITGNFILFFGIITSITILYSQKIVIFLAPGFSLYEQNAVNILSKIFLLGIPIMIFNEVNSTLLVSKNKGSKAIFSNLLNNLFLLVISLVLLKTLKIKAFVYATFISLIIKSLYLIYTNRVDLNIFKLRINLRNKDFYKIIKLMIPIVVSSIGAQLNFIVDRKIASTLSTGAISTLNYANKIVQLPLGIFLGAIILSSFSLLVEAINDSDDYKYRNLIKQKIEIILILMLFTVMIISIYSKTIISIIYKRGDFTLEDVKITARVLSFYTPSLIGISFSTIFQKIFHANKSMKVPAIISFIGVILNVMLNILLSKFLGVEGLALATSISTIFTAILFFIVLKSENGVYYNYQKILLIILSNIVLLFLNLTLLKNINIKNELFYIIFIGIINMLIYVIILVKIYGIKKESLKKRRII